VGPGAGAGRDDVPASGVADEASLACEVLDCLGDRGRAAAHAPMSSTMDTTSPGLRVPPSICARRAAVICSRLPGWPALVAPGLGAVACPPAVPSTS